MLNMEDESPGQSASFPVLSSEDLNRVAQTIIQLYDAHTAGNPSLAVQLQKQLQDIQSSVEAWGLISGLSTHEDANVRFFGAHTAQVKISRDWDTLPKTLHSALLQLLLDVLSNTITPSNPQSYQPGNAPVVRKIFGSLSSLLLRLPFHLSPSPLSTVLNTISNAAISAGLPPSQPASGFNTPLGHGATTPHDPSVGRKMRSWGLEWLGICVEEIGRAGISDQKRNALRKHLEMDLPLVMETIRGSMNPPSLHGLGSPQEMMQESTAACKCAESWIDYGLGVNELTELMPSLYNLLPLPAASSAIVEALSESVFRFGKGTKVLTEPLVSWCIGPGRSLIGSADDEPSEEVLAFAKLLAALVEHSSEWIVARIQNNDVQTFLGLVLRLTGWQGTGKVEEEVSELTLPIYPLLQEAIMDSDSFQSPHETSTEWAIAKHFFGELVQVTKRKVRWPPGDDPSGIGLDKEERESFDEWRRDAGEVIVGAYYILREDMLRSLVKDAHDIADGQWQDIEAVLHCIRYSSEAVPLGESENLPALFGDVLSRLSNRSMQGRGEQRLRLTTICLIQAYEEWFKYHPDHLLPVLSYLVQSLTSSLTSTISRYSAEALRALCDICRNKLVEHIGAFSQLHEKIGDLGAEEQIKVIQGITSVIQALPPSEAVGPVQGILSPIVDRLAVAVNVVRSDQSTANQELLVQSLSSLTACFKGLSPSDDDMFDLESEQNEEEKENAIKAMRDDSTLVNLRQRIEDIIREVVQVWNGDGQLADSISSLIKSSTLSSSETLISLRPLPLLSLVTAAAERAPSALWLSLASTLVLRINAPSVWRKKPTVDANNPTNDDVERWNIIGDAASRLVVVASHSIGTSEGMRDHPDIVESWFKFCSSTASRFPGVLLRIPMNLVETYMTLGIIGLGTQERFSLKSTCDFFIALFQTTKYPSPLEEITINLLKHLGPGLLRAILLSAGSEGPRSVIPNLSELLASFVQRTPGADMSQWLDAILSEEGFPSQRTTHAAKERFKDVVARSRTTKKMREALNEFALVARGLDNTTYGNATIM